MDLNNYIKSVVLEQISKTERLQRCLGKVLSVDGVNVTVSLLTGINQSTVTLKNNTGMTATVGQIVTVYHWGDISKGYISPHCLKSEGGASFQIDSAVVMTEEQAKTYVTVTDEIINMDIKNGNTVVYGNPNNPFFLQGYPVLASFENIDYCKFLNKQIAIDTQQVTAARETLSESNSTTGNNSHWEFKCEIMNIQRGSWTSDNFVDYDGGEAVSVSGYKYTMGFFSRTSANEDWVYKSYFVEYGSESNKYGDIITFYVPDGKTITSLGVVMSNNGSYSESYNKILLQCGMFCCIGLSDGSCDYRRIYYNYTPGTTTKRYVFDSIYIYPTDIELDYRSGATAISEVQPSKVSEE